VVDRFADQVIEHGVGEGVLRRGAGPDRDPPLTDVEVTGQDQLAEQGGGQAEAVTSACSRGLPSWSRWASLRCAGCTCRAHPVPFMGGVRRASVDARLHTQACDRRCRTPLTSSSDRSPAIDVAGTPIVVEAEGRYRESVDTDLQIMCSTTVDAATTFAAPCREVDGLASA
jgi:hypothetical protein